MKKSPRFTPLWIAMGVVMGILIGTFYANHFSGNRLNIINTSGHAADPRRARPALRVYHRP